MIDCKRILTTFSPRALYRLHPRTMHSRSNVVERVEIPENMKIDLSENEHHICQLLNDCCIFLREEKNITTSCRIAGGWVRDKLLGSASNDIDVALSDIMGFAFAEHLRDFAARKGIQAGTISKITQNPDQSKHLETATLKIFGMDIDLVNLRSEEYAENSRIPTEVAFGTPLQDALRRDITINALFYNVHTGEVEDFTEKGMHDLQSGIIRTPLPPRETFSDDPLRVLRCIRFASRFGFELTEDVREAAKDQVIQESLISKVTRERIGEEVSKMMTGRDPFHSIKLIHSLSLYHSIFSCCISADVHSSLSQPPSSPDFALAATAVLRTLLSPNKTDIPPVHTSLLARLNSDTSGRARLFLAAAMTPFKNVYYRDKKGKLQTTVALVIRDALKRGSQNHYLDGIPMLFAAAETYQNYLNKQEKFTDSKSERVTIGLLLRNKNIHSPNNGTHWATSLLFSLVQELVPLYNMDGDYLNVKQSSAIIALYNSFADSVHVLGLTEAGDAKPLLDGRDVVKIMGAGKDGAWVGQILMRVIEWQFDHPHESKEACAQWLRTEHNNGRLQGNTDIEPTSKRPRLQ